MNTINGAQAIMAKETLKIMLDRWEVRGKPTLTPTQYRAYLDVAYALRELVEAA